MTFFKYFRDRVIIEKFLSMGCNANFLCSEKKVSEKKNIIVKVNGIAL